MGTKIDSIKSEIKDDGYIDAAPPMMILPEVDAQQFELLNFSERSTDSDC